MWDKFSGFYKLPVEERLSLVGEHCHLTGEEREVLLRGQLPLGVANRMVENVVGVFPYPVGIATNFRVNGRDYLVPMVIEESSVIAAASKAAKLALATGGFHAEAPESVMIGQLQLVKVPDAARASVTLQDRKVEVLDAANACDPLLVKLGGGAVDLKVRQLESSMGPMLVLHLLVDVKDAMGANTINTMLERVTPLVEAMTGGQACLRILSNLATHRVARASAVFSKDVIGGPEVVERVLWAAAFAEADPFRAATHNKGILNGIIAVAQATGNDTRAIEAGAHAYAAHGTPYRPLTKFVETPGGDLKVDIEVPLTVGRVGGITSIHPQARVAWKVLGVDSIKQFYEVLAAVGLAQNFAAVLALATEGIQRGHMKLHASNIAMMAGAKGREVDLVASFLVESGSVSLERAKELLEGFRGAG
ncbi:MAG: hydroxymethylglutaryl-CoA reductase, degradative [Promethearchaeota archaeon]